MSLIRQLIGQTAIYGLGHILSRVLYFLVLTSYLTIRFDDTMEYGIYSDMYAYASLFIVILSYRLDTAFFRFGSKDGQLHKSFSTAFISMIMSTVVIVSIGIVFSSEIAKLLHYSDNVHYVKWFTIILGFDVLVLIPYAKLRLENKAAIFMGYRILNILLTIALIFFFLEGPGGRIFAQNLPFIKNEVDYVFFSNLIASASIFLLMVPIYKGIKWSFDFDLWKKMVVYALPLVIVGIAGSFNQFFSAPLQKYLLGNDISNNLADVGIYAAPMRIAALLTLFTTAFNYAAEPFFFKNADKKESKDLYGKICLLFVMIVGIIILVLNYYLDIFQFLIGKNYREGLVIIPILLFAYLGYGIYYNLSIWYKLADKTIYGALISTIGAIITFVFSLVFLPKWGYIASAWAALTTYIVMNILVYIFGQIHYPIKYPIKKLAITIGIIVSLVFLGIMLDDHLNTTMATVIKSALLIGYLGYIYLMEKETLLDIISKKK